MNNLASANWKKALNTGLISGILAIMISLIGMVESFGDTFIINRFVSLGDILHMAPILILIYVAIKTYDQATWKLQLAYSTFSGAIAGLMLTVLVLFGSAMDIRENPLPPLDVRNRAARWGFHTHPQRRIARCVSYWSVQATAALAQRHHAGHHMGGADRHSARPDIAGKLRSN
jgi:hypothetical protein